MFRNRPLADVIMIFITFTACAVILLAGVGIFVIELFHPEVDTSHIGNYIAEVEKTLLSVSLGYVGGRQVKDVVKNHKAGQERREE